MKKKILILAIAAMTAATVFGGCGKKQETREATDGKTQESGENAERKEAQDEKITPDEEEALGQTENEEPRTVTLIAKETSYNSDGNIVRQFEYEYDGSGKETMSRDTHYKEESGVWYKDLVYEKVRDDCRLICSLYADIDWDMFQWTLTTWYGPDGVVTRRYGDQCEYDRSGNITRVTEYDYDSGAVRGWYEYEYDNAGNRIKETRYDADGVIKEWKECEYDKNGNRTKYIAHGIYAALNDGISWRCGAEYDESGNMIKHMEYDTDGTMREWNEYEYDESCNMAKCRKYSGWIAGWYEYEYDESGNETKYMSYNADGTIEGWTEYEYDEFGNEMILTEYNKDGGRRIRNYKYPFFEYNPFDVEYNADGAIVGDGVIEYDIYGNETRWVEYSAGGVIAKEWVFEPSGKISRYMQYNADGAVIRGLEFGYDEFGNQTKIIEYGEEGIIREGFEREYDTYGNITKCIQYYSDPTNPWSAWLAEYEYDISGNIIKKTYCNMEGNMLSWEEYNYDKSGNRTKATTYDAEGSMIQGEELEYDSSGNLLRCTEYRADNTIQKITEYITICVSLS